MMINQITACQIIKREKERRINERERGNERKRKSDLRTTHFEVSKMKHYVT